MLRLDTFKGKTVLVTGHTGFKGAWLCEWLQTLGARVVGFSLKHSPETDPCFTSPALFSELGLKSRIQTHIEGDIRDPDPILEALRVHRPDFIFHLAAQPLVLRSYQDPRLTFETNVQGTLNLMEAVRTTQLNCILVIVTTDKVYRNSNAVQAFRETDALGGHDPYSASKACVELLVASYRDSFTQPGEGKSSLIAVARGGNVIGGGDWAENRIVPDAVRAFQRGVALNVRNPQATRPWQHVLELLGGYLHLAASMARAADEFHTARGDRKVLAGETLRRLCSAYNFGPLITSNRPVSDLVKKIRGHWPGKVEIQQQSPKALEAEKLCLGVEKAFHNLGWIPRWSFEETVEKTISWYRDYYDSAQGDCQKVHQLVDDHIRDFSLG